MSCKYVNRFLQSHNFDLDDNYDLNYCFNDKQLILYESNFDNDTKMIYF